jgi:hypothetical protein
VMHADEKLMHNGNFMRAGIVLRRRK